MHSFSTFFPRLENSEGEKKSIEFIEGTFRDLEIEYRVYDLAESEKIHSFSSVIHGWINGAGSDNIYLLFPLNHRVGALPDEDGSFNLATALSLAVQLKHEIPPINVHLVFLGAELGPGLDYPVGSQEFLTRHYPADRSVFLYINFETPPVKINLLPGGTGKAGPLWIMESAIKSMERAGISFSTNAQKTQIYRIGLNDTPSKIDPYLEAGYPAFLFESDALTTPVSTVTVTRNIEKTDMFLADLIYSLPMVLPEQWDSNYLHFESGNIRFILDEKAYIILLLVLLGLVLLYPFIAEKQFLKYFRTIRKNIWSLPVFYLVMFLYLFTATMALEKITAIRENPTLWKEAPFLFMLLKIFIAGFLFSLTERLLWKIPFSRRGSFYSASALFYLLISIIVLSLYNIFLVYYLVWSFIFAFFFTLSGNRIIKFTLLILSGFSIIMGLFDIFQGESFRAMQIIILSPVRGNLIITVHLIPFMLMFFRLRFLKHPKEKKLARRVTFAQDFFLLASVIGLGAYLLTFSPYGPFSPLPLTITDSYDEIGHRREIVVDSPGSIGDLTIETDDFIQQISTESRTYKFSLPVFENRLNASYSVESFLDRMNIDILIEALDRPETVEVTLHSEKEILIFDSSFPYVFSSTNRREARFRIGRNPPTPLPLSLTLPGDFAGTIRIKAEYNPIPYRFNILAENISAETRMLVFTEAEIKR